MIRVLLLLVSIAAPAGAADLAGLDWEQHPGRLLPLDVALRDADGQPTTLGRVGAGLPLVLAPGYFKCPNLCGVVRDDLFAALAASRLQPGRDYSLALVTIDPGETAGDAAAAREAALGRFPEARPAALTGPAASLAAIATAAGFPARYDAAAKQFLHPAGLLVASPSGHIAAYLLGVGYAPADLEAAVANARAGLASAAEPIHLFCFSYDPATGRLTLAITEALRAAAVLTVLATGAGLAYLGRRA